MQRNGSKLCLFSAIACGAVMGTALTAQAAITIDTVTVGNPGQAGVGYTYGIGKYEVTNAQYAAFLNSADPGATNSLNLWASDLAYHGVSLNNGAPSGSKYAAVTDYENYPVHNVTYARAARFANWLNNGQNGTTETGAYTIVGGSTLGVTRNSGWTYALPSVAEWDKAAYWNPATGTNYQYPTSSNTITAESPVGGANSANMAGVVVDGWTPVGAYTNAKSPYGAFDMAGNVAEWSDTLPPWGDADTRGSMGGDLYHATTDAKNSGVTWQYAEQSWGEDFYGFRIVTTVVPEPASLSVLGLSAAGLLARRRRA